MIAYINARIPFSKQDAFIIKDGMFYEVGKKHKILNHSVSQIIDLKHQTVLPGMHDSHLHVVGLGMQMQMVDATKHTSIASFLEALKAEDTPVVMGRSFHEAQMRENRMITRDDLDQAFKDRPVIVYRACGQMCTANSEAIKQANAIDGVPEASEDIDLKRGLFKEDGMQHVLKLRDVPTLDALKSMILTAQRDLLSKGVTSVGSDDFHVTKAPYERVIEAFKHLDESGSLKLNVFEQVNLPVLRTFDDFLKKGYARKQYGRYTMGPLKLLADGSLGARSAFMKSSYHDADTRGIALFDQPTLETFIRRAHAHDMDFAIHGIGDGIIERILDAKEAIDTPGRRDSIIHAQLADHDQIKRMQTLNVGAQTQPIFLNSDIPIIPERLGPRSNETYLFNTMIKSGVTTTLSTDAPIEDTNPFENMYVAITRQSIKHPSYPPFLKEEGMDVYRALEAYTKTPAYFTYEEKQLGQIKKGHRADFLIVKGFDEENVESLLNTTVRQTYIRGECVHEEDA